MNLCIHLKFHSRFSKVKFSQKIRENKQKNPPENFLGFCFVFSAAQTKLEFSSQN